MYFNTFLYSNSKCTKIHIRKDDQMFINLKEGKLTLYDLMISKKITPVFEKISYEGIKEHNSFTATHWGSEGRKSNNTVVRNMYWKKTGRTIEYNDFYSQDEDEYQIDYDIYTLPHIYLVIENLMKNNYESLNDLTKYQLGNITDVRELEVFKNHQKQIYEYIYLKKILEADPAYTLELLNLLKANSKGKLKQNLKDIKSYLNIYSLSLEGIKIKEKEYGK